MTPSQYPAQGVRGSPAISREAASVPPANSLFALAGAYVLSRVLHTAVQLGIADQLAEAPMPLDKLANAVGADRAALYRLLRVLTAHGIFHETADAHFELNAQAEPLRRDSPRSVRPLILSTGSDWSQQLWSGALQAMKTGRPAFDHVFGMPLFQYFQQNPEAGSVFDEGLACLTRHVAPAILAAHDFTRYSRIIDVGGGNGMLLAQILRKNTQAKGVLVESPPVIERARDLLTSEKVVDRCECVAGSFFDPLPHGGDAYVLKNVLHDWPDEQAIRILKNCRGALAPDGRVLIIEAILDRNEVNEFPLLMDINMLMTTGGAERTEREFRELCADAGLKIQAIAKCLPFHLLETSLA
jgi:SAM-dependent methyltransferase